MNRQRYPGHSGARGGGRQAARVRPVYREVRDVLAGAPPASANTGLLFDRYANVWSGHPEWKPAKAQPSVRLQFLNEVAQHAAARKAVLRPLLEAFHLRRRLLWEKLGARKLVLRSCAPLVSGLGMAHALEAGFVWDRNLGVPFLPGSSLKGAVRAWAEQWADAGESDLRRWFGDSSDEGAGCLTFFAAYPVIPPVLRTDVMNPHFKAWYERGETPGDWLSPEPVFFLAVERAMPFETAVHLRHGGSSRDLDAAAELLAGALSNLGVGAKTAVGYGLFTGD